MAESLSVRSPWPEAPGAADGDLSSPIAFPPSPVPLGRPWPAPGPARRRARTRSPAYRACSGTRQRLRRLTTALATCRGYASLRSHAIPAAPATASAAQTAGPAGSTPETASPCPDIQRG